MSTSSGCEENKPFLQEEIGPSSNSFGCCTAVTGDPDLDRIGSLPGNKASADCSYYIDNEIIVTVPIWDYAGGTGANGWYHIIGFAGFQLTGPTKGVVPACVVLRAFTTSRAAWFKSTACPLSHELSSLKFCAQASKFALSRLVAFAPGTSKALRSE